MGRLFPYLRWFWTTVILAVLLGFVGNGLAALWMTGKFAPSQEALLLVWTWGPLLVSVALVLGLVTIGSWWQHAHGYAPLPVLANMPQPGGDSEESRRLRILQDKVEAFWIRGVLERSVHGVALLNLGKEARPDAVHHPWQMVLEVPSRQRRVLPADTSVKHVFDDLAGCMLVLGEPGSGKTTSLLELARDLFTERQRAPGNSVPAIFNLSSWSTTRNDIATWLADELESKYRIPHELAVDWVNRDKLVLLFDGLDEVHVEHQSSCVKSLNSFYREHGLVRMVVCCRGEDYERIGVKLELHGAVYLQPLDLSKVYDYVVAGGVTLAGLDQAIRLSPTLQTLAARPLMLAIMTLAYGGKQVSEILSAQGVTSGSELEALFANYVRAMFSRIARTSMRDYSLDDAVGWLSFLATQLRAHNQTQFLLEEIQESWLASDAHRRVFRWGSMAVSAAVFGGVVGVTWGEAAKVALHWDPIFAAFTFGVPSALSVGLAAYHNFRWSGRVVVGVSYGILMTMTSYRTYRSVVAIAIGALGGAAAGLGFGLVLGNMRTRVGSQTSVAPPFHVQTVEKLSWSWRSAVRGLVSHGLAVGVATFFVLGLTAVFTLALPAGIAAGLAGGTVVAMTCGVLLGLTSLEIEKKSSPNQGIWMSARNAAVSLALGSVVSGLPLGLAMLMGMGWTEGLAGGIAIGAYAGWGAALFFGGNVFIRHFSLRLLLSLEGKAPFRYVRFLDCAVERVFLQRVGGGYIFVHRLLMEHFAARTAAVGAGRPATREGAFVGGDSPLN